MKRVCLSINNMPRQLLITCPTLALLGFLQAKEGNDLLFRAFQAEASAQNSPWQWELGGQLDTTFWSTGNPASALAGNHGQTLDPRLALTLDIQHNTHWLFHATARADQGFDPAFGSGLEVRLDETFLRYSAFDNSLNFQIGKFATVFGSWVNQHSFFDDPFLTAPLPYSQIIGLAVANPNALTPNALTQRAQASSSIIYSTPKRLWASSIWGASYGSGVSLSGNRSGFEYALEIKNFGLTRRAEEWDQGLEGFENPTFTGRIGYRPNAGLAYGISASRGPYLEPDAERFLPNGMDIGDLPYTTLGIDFSWSHHNLIFSGEAIGSQYETLATGDLRSLTYYSQLRWKFFPGLSLAGRWGQTFNNEARGQSGETVEWSPNLWRASASLGWRASPDLLFKGEYNYTSIDDSRVDGQHLFGLGASYRF